MVILSEDWIYKFSVSWNDSIVTQVSILTKDDKTADFGEAGETDSSDTYEFSPIRRMIGLYGTYEFNSINV